MLILQVVQVVKTINKEISNKNRIYNNNNKKMKNKIKNSKTIL